MLMCTVCCASCDEYDPLEYYDEPQVENGNDDGSDGEDHWIIWPCEE